MASTALYLNLLWEELTTCIITKATLAVLMGNVRTKKQQNSNFIAFKSNLPVLCVSDLVTAFKVLYKESI